MSLIGLCLLCVIHIASLAIEGLLINISVLVESLLSCNLVSNSPPAPAPVRVLSRRVKHEPNCQTQHLSESNNPVP